MKTITNENKVRFYAPYWHLNVAYGGNNTSADTIGYMLLDLEESGYNDEDFKYWKVYLKPLSDISDEHKVELSKILSNGKNELTINTAFNGSEWKHLNYYATQYLQSKGYALPYMDYSVDDLVELEVIILKTK